MSQQEFLRVIASLRTSYPGSQALPSTQEAISEWYSKLSDLNFGTCLKAMDEYIKNNDYPPTIAGIRRSCTNEVKAFAKPHNEAWDDVMVAVRKYGTYGAIEAMNSFDDITRKCVKQIGWYEICTSSNTGYLKRDFKESYEEYKKQYDCKVQANDGALGIEDKGVKN